jgi:hypothetical protein
MANWNLTLLIVGQDGFDLKKRTEAEGYNDTRPQHDLWNKIEFWASCLGSVQWELAEREHLGVMLVKCW